MRITVVEYVCADGSSPYADWFDSLDPQAAAKVTTAKLRLEMGHTSAMKWFSGIGEYRIDWGPGYRIYLAKDGAALIVLFGGGIKKRQAADIARAKDLPNIRPANATGHEQKDDAHGPHPRFQGYRRGPRQT